VSYELLEACCSHTIFGFCLVSVLFGRDAQAIEETKFKVIESGGKFELRQYSPHIVAETFVEADFSKAGNEAFNRLAGYINGQNRRKQTSQPLCLSSLVLAAGLKTSYT